MLFRSGGAAAAPVGTCLFGGFVQRLHLRRCCLQCLDAAGRGGVGAHERWRLALGGGLHFLPEADSGLGVVAGAGSQFQADEVGCDIITATNDILAKLSLVGKNLDGYSLETVKMFYQDAKASGFSIG